jgi:hypothetical protein
MMKLLKLTALVLAATSILAIQEMLVMAVTPLVAGSFRAALSGSFAWAAPAKLQYRLPKTKKLASSQGAGARSGEELLVKTVLLVPKDHIALTTAGRPTFFWYFSRVPDFPVEFALYQQGVAKPILIQRVAIEKAGIIQLAIPQNIPELVADPNKKYRWSISLIKLEDEPSTNPTYQAWVQRVQLTPDQMNQIQAANTNHDRASLYAQSGFWYDSLGQIATVYISKPNDSDLRADMRALLEQVDLPKTIAP